MAPVPGERAQAAVRDGDAVSRPSEAGATAPLDPTEALRLIAADGCRNFYGTDCWTAGRKVGAPEAAYAVCDGCLAFAALSGRAASEPVACPVCGEEGTVCTKCSACGEEVLTYAQSMAHSRRYAREHPEWREEYIRRHGREPGVVPLGIIGAPGDSPEAGSGGSGHGARRGNAALAGPGGALTRPAAGVGAPEGQRQFTAADLDHTLRSGFVNGYMAADASGDLFDDIVGRAEAAFEDAYPPAEPVAPADGREGER